MTDPQGLVAMAFAFLVVTASPGPATLACVSVAMGAGRAAGLRFAAGLALGLAAWGAVAASGFGAILAASAEALFWMKLAGAGYLFWLAWGAIRPGPDARRHAPSRRWFTSGLLLNLSNPKAVLAWLAALSVGLGPHAGAGQVAAATLLCALIGLAVYAGWAGLFSAPRVRRVYARGRRLIDRATAALFTLAGVSLLRSAFTR